jgi:hypothetical protein
MNSKKKQCQQNDQIFEKRDKDGYYKESDLRKLEPADLIKLMIREQSYQIVMNAVRNELKNFND